MNRHLLSLPVLLIALAACSGDDPAESSTTPAPTQTSAAPSTTAAPTTQAPATSAPTTSHTVSSSVAPTTTTAPATTPPPPPSSPSSNPTESYPFPTTPAGQPDWVPILQELLEAGTALSLEPNLDQITNYCLDNSDCFQDWSAYIENLIADDAHAEGLVPDRVLSVEISPAQGDRDPIETGAVVLTAQVEVVGNDDGARVADSDGNTLYVISRNAQPGDVVAESYFLGLNPEREWRVAQESTSESG